MNTLYCMVGPPGSGKSIFAHNLRGLTEGKIISPDAIRQSLFGHKSVMKFDNMVWRIAYDQLADLSEGYGDIIFDATMCKPSYRKDLLKNVFGYTTRKYAVVLDTPLFTCLDRNNNRANIHARQGVLGYDPKARVPDDVIERMHKNLQDNPVKEEEGWHKIFHIGDFDK